jgi:hypothetical protein
LRRNSPLGGPRCFREDAQEWRKAVLKVKLLRPSQKHLLIRSIIEFTVKHIDPDEKMTFAYLNKDGVPVLCSWYEWKEWWKREGDRCQVKYDRVDDWEIETRFQGRSAALDGPPLFWEVRFFSPRIVSHGARHFGTKESALAFHAEVVERIISGEFEA